MGNFMVIFFIKGLTIILCFNLQNIANFVMDVIVEFYVYKVSIYGVADL